MNKKDIQQELIDLEAMYDKLKMLIEDEQVKLKGIIPADIQVQIDDIRAETSKHTQVLLNQIGAKEKLIVDETIKLAESVTGNIYKAIYQPGKLSWDGKLLTEFAKKHYKVLAMRKRGKPSVRISRK